MSDSVRPHSRQPTRLPPSLGFSRQEHWSGLPFPSPMQESEVAQSCPTLSDPMDCSPPGSSVHGIFQASVPEWGAVAFSNTHLGPLQIFPPSSFPPYHAGFSSHFLTPALQTPHFLSCALQIKSKGKQNKNKIHRKRPKDLAGSKEGNGNPVQDSCPENPTDWRATVTKESDAI